MYGKQKVGSMSVRFKHVCDEQKNVFFIHSYTAKCGNRLRVEVHAKNASVSGFACRPFYEWRRRHLSEGTFSKNRLSTRCIGSASNQGISQKKVVLT